jgi:diguanylate cyclase (GGDEF)-like protein
VLNASKAEHLQDLFSNEKWKGQLTTLSDTTGFTLSLYSGEGREIFSTAEHNPPCSGLLSSPYFKSQCEAYCRAPLAGVIQQGKPKIFKCYAKIVSFALPVEYLNEKAVILGQGSFATYQDFREFTNYLSASEIDELSVKAPLSFTNVQQARNACSLVDSSLNQLLKNAQETFALQQKIDSLKTVIGRWGVASREESETIHEHMAANLLPLLDLHAITVLSLDRQRGVFTHRYSLKKSGSAKELFTISENDSIIEELGKGKPFVSSLDPLMAGRTEFLPGVKTWYFFPVMVNKKVESILGIFDSVLKESDISVIIAFCKQTALFTENQRLRQDLFDKFDRFAAVSELTQSITAILDYETLLKTILEKSANLLKAEQGSLMLVDYETNGLLLEAKKGATNGRTDKLRIRKGEGIAGRVAELGEPFLVANVEIDPRIKQKNRRHYKTLSCVSVPLKIEERVIGVLNLSDKTSGEVFDEEDLRLIQSFATHAAIVMERNVLYSQTEKLKKLSITDSLTGLLNRRYFHERQEEEVSRSGRHGRNLSVMMLDIDGFKYYNDTFGHRIGDKALKVIADIILNSVRSIDIVSRHGGDEFMVILPETDKTLAIQIAERLRADVAKIVLPTADIADAPSIAITLSIGMVCYPEHGGTAELLLEHVDKALYLAKKRGKNRIEVYS